MTHILITGANGQVGTDLVQALAGRPGVARLVATDLPAASSLDGRADGLVYESLDVTDAGRLRDLLDRHEIDTVYHLASLLSARGETRPDQAWAVNMDGLKHVLDAARTRALRIFWPSSIAVFGPQSPKDPAPQHTVLDPSTMYGVTKVSGELLCRYYHDHFGVDVRSLRYPGLISYKTAPGGGTTDFAVEMFFAAAAGEPYTCFVRPETRLPMMYMPDAIRAALDLMDADAARLTVRTSYNLAAVSFSAGELAEAIRRRVPGFTVRYEPDARQRIADSWPAVIDDAPARDDWDWRPDYDLDALVDDMLAHVPAGHDAGKP